jgi:DNA-binding NarL/FixJ family response regulator
VIRPRVLVVDDEPEGRDLLVRGLRRLGWDAESAGDGGEAIPRLDTAWDAVVTDLRMPRVDGLQLLAELRLRQPGALRVVITAFSDKGSVLAALNAGAHHLLEKPFATDALDAVLRRLLGERDAAGQAGLEHRLATLPLTPREREMVLGVLRGLGNKEIAVQLGIGEQSVKNALSAAYQRLGIGSRSELFHLLFPH